MITLIASLLFAQQTGTWPFLYPDDSRPGAMLDLRYLNEGRAGETGYVRLSADGRSFARGDGKPIRFWPVNSNGFRLKPEEMGSNTRFLAKMGVNMVRIFASLGAKGKGSRIDDYDPEEVDRIQRYVAACEKEGIYATISPYWANGGSANAQSSWGLGYGDGEGVWGLLFFNRKLQDAYKTWVRHLYLDPNPYTGVPLAKDPAVAIVQIQNEDGLLFWTFQGIKPAQKKILSRTFGLWLTRRYGSLNAARDRYRGAERPGDDWTDGAPELLDTWVLTQPQTGAMKTRADDQTAFLIDVQKEFYADMAGFYRNDLGYKGLINACNWITADPVRQNDAERYTYTPTDVMAVNRYYDGVHKGPNNGWRIDEGDFFTDDSALTRPRNLPVNLKQVVGHPMVVTESCWVTPLEYQAEAPLVCAAYESLSGVQGLYWFELGAENYNPEPYFDFVNFKDGDHALSKWEAGIPQTLGQFPAASLIYRMGYVRHGAPVVHEERTREELDEREIPVIAEDPSYDPNHHGEDSRAGASQATVADPLAYLVGPVEVKYDGDPSKTVVKDLSRYIDHEAKTVRSETGEESLDYGKGLFQLDSPRAQGVAGFLKKAGGEFRLKDVTIRSDNEYAAVTVVSLDGKPIASSRRLLVQVGTVARPTGWQQVPASGTGNDGKTPLEGFDVVATGRMPWQIQNSVVALSVSNAGLSKATALDPAGYPAGEVTVQRSGGTASLRLPANAMYVILK